MIKLEVTVAWSEDKKSVTLSSEDWKKIVDALADLGDVVNLDGKTKQPIPFPE